jgi:oligoribonuclease NrnB/cAMP/cGMP phosphodiesterase (DHH superfamily)
MKITYHLSHNDTDGYGSQYITSTLFPDIKYFNSGYGKQIGDNFKKILKKISKSDTLLITDLNLTMEQAAFINEKSEKIGFTLLLIDHHASGTNVAKRYDWYNLNINFCATKLTYDYFYKDNPNFHIAYVADIINAYDLYQEENKFFIQGKTLNGVVMGNRGIFPEIFLDKTRKIIFQLIKEVSFSLAMTSGNVIKSEAIVSSVIRDYLSLNIIGADKLPFPTLKAEYISPLLKEGFHFERFLIDSKNIDVYFNMIDLFQEITHIRFKNYNTDIIVHISPNGSISLRSSSDKNPVDKWAESLFNGGGHKKAAGGILKRDGLNKLSYGDAMDMFYQKIKHL